MPVAWTQWFKQLAGSWTITWSTGEAITYRMTSQGVINITGVMGNFNLAASDSEAFPASKGWFTWTYMGYTYYIRLSGGKVVAHRFSADCTLSFKNLANYCASGNGVQFEGLSL